MSSAASILFMSGLLWLSPGPVAGQGPNSTRATAKQIVVTGRLTGEGVECQALRAKNGKLYTLAGPLRGFKVGDKVRVVGSVAEISTCQQGTTLTVLNIKRVK